MARIKIEDLPLLEELGTQEMRGIFGGNSIDNPIEGIIGAFNFLSHPLYRVSYNEKDDDYMPPVAEEDPIELQDEEQIL